ncbi:MAG: endopeptidase La [Anaerolineae bacterium]|nr:endopeptidase La [Candidatus Roseilinea sp.]MDW8451024.1 endopeptidase La [Anaerolineae bacterium]
MQDWLIGASFGNGLPQQADAKAQLPDVFEAPVLPLRDLVVYPRSVMPLTIGRERSLRALDVARSLGLAVAIAQKSVDVEDPRPSDLYEIGAAVAIGRMLNLPDGSASLIVQGRARVKVVEWLQATPFLMARVEVLHEPQVQSPAAEALMRAVLTLFDNVVGLNERIPEEAFVYAMNIHEPGWLADFIAQTMPLNVAARQSILEAVDPVSRLQKMSTILARELDVLELEDRIHERAQSEVDKSQREYYLREQLRSIQTELGEIDASVGEINLLRERLKKKALPDAVRERAEREINKLEQLHSMSPEVSMVRDYVEWLLELPWTERTEDILDVKRAARILDERHYGLTKAKERILEHIAVRKLKGDLSRSPILCFVGPPGTGKTSLARSIADSLGRRFVRMSVGGVHDEAEIRGHRRTYVGALPGRILQTMRRAGTINPLFVLDEIDKLGSDFRGDPSAALLEVLDPEQNFEFEDHYLDMPYDLSQVMWVTTANYLYDIPPALRDRLEVIEFTGYVEEEKLEIARRFLVPKQIAENGLDAAQASNGHKPITFSDEVLRHIIREYTYEAGVRNLDRAIATICRKIARRVAEGKPHVHRLTPGMLHRFLGPPQFDFGKVDEQDQIGVANGVAWDEAGGDLMQIEVTLMEGKGELTLTGQLGEVMQESAKAALSYARARANEFGIARKTFEKSDIHIHVPEGAISKEGPSAGIAMATALISALTKIPVRRDVAMTGEITLRGRVLPIGGLKEKLLAAHRAGIRTFIMPKKNAKDLEEVPKRVQRDMTLIQAATMDEVLRAALARQPQPLAPDQRNNGAQKPSRSRKKTPSPAKPTRH